MSRGTIIILTILILFTPPAFAGTYSGGTGDPNTPYLIDSADDIIEMSNTPDDWDKNFLMIADVNMVDYTFTTAVIAPDTDSDSFGHQGAKFEGVFDGNGHVINGMTINPNNGNDYLGLFGYIYGSAGEVKNLDLENVNISGGDDSWYIGSLCGCNVSGTLSNCYSTGNVSGDDYLGGLCGYNSSGTISNCYSTGSVCGGVSSNYLGGLCGYNEVGMLSNCYSTGSVSGGYLSMYLGGLCGYSSSGMISYCYSTGSVSGGDGSDYLGGLCGQNYSGTLSNCYYYILAGYDNGLGTGLDDTQMLEACSFVNFDFAENTEDGTDDYWSIVLGHCPKLTWQSDDGPLLTTAVPETTLEGSGYSYDPFQINSAADFEEFRTNDRLDRGYYILNIDINLSWKTTAVIERYFGGRFDGGGHVIENININTSGIGTDYLGLFSKTCGPISNLGLENIDIRGGINSFYLGGLCGSSSGTISNCYSTGSVSGWDGSDYLGGLCGRNSGTIINCYSTCSVDGDDYLGGLCGRNSGTISHCHLTGNVSGDDYLGGLCGYNSSGTISNCYSTGSVIGGRDSDYLGGLCGYNEVGMLSNCYSTGSVSGGYLSMYLGGLCGYNWKGTLSNCYSTGNVSGDNSYYLGGLCGSNDDGTITNSFWDRETSGITISSGGIGLTTEQMQTQSSFTDYGWDFVGEDVNGTFDYWRMCVDGVHYPHLWWQYSKLGDFDCPDGVGLEDILMLAGYWLETEFESLQSPDATGDGQINLDDFAITSENFEN